MKNIICLFLLAIAFSITSCGEKKEEKTAVADLKDVQLSSDKDPVCQMSVAKKPADTINYNGKIYGFCNPGCKDEFKKDPAQYVAQ